MKNLFKKNVTVNTTATAFDSKMQFKNGLVNGAGAAIPALIGSVVSAMVIKKINAAPCKTTEATKKRREVKSSSEMR